MRREQKLVKYHGNLEYKNKHNFQSSIFYKNIKLELNITKKHSYITHKYYKYHQLSELESNDTKLPLVVIEQYEWEEQAEAHDGANEQIQSIILVNFLSYLY